MTSLTAVLASAGASGCVAAALCRWVLPRLAEPVDGDGKTAYRDLPTARFITVTAAVAAAAGALAAWLPEPYRPLWWVLATLGVLLAAVDAATTWLPLSLTRIAWAAMTGAALLVLLRGGETTDLVRIAIGSAGAGLLYLLVRLVSRGGFGFGDVRYAPLLGAAAAGPAYGLLLWALTLGAVVGAGHGILRLLRRRTGPFPYAPAMLTGAFLAAGLWSASGGG